MIYLVGNVWQVHKYQGYLIRRPLDPFGGPNNLVDPIGVKLASAQWTRLTSMRKTEGTDVYTR